MIRLGPSVTLLLFLPTVAWSVSGALIRGPTPTNKIAPIGGTVEFTCVVNTTELPSGQVFSNIFWSVNNQVLPSGPNQRVTGTVIRTGTLRLNITVDYTSGVPIQCGVTTGFIGTLGNTTTILTAYGMFLGRIIIIIIV